GGKHVERGFERRDGARHVVIGMRGRGKSAGPGGDVYAMQQKSGSDLVHQFQRQTALQSPPRSLARVNFLRRLVAAIEVEIRELAVGAPPQATSADRRIDSVANRRGRACRAIESVAVADLLEGRNARRGGNGCCVVGSLMR